MIELPWALVLLPAVAMAAASTTSTDLKAAVDAWHQQRIRNLTAEDGWLSLVGLYWLEPGTHTAGSAPGAEIEFPPNAPAKLGTFTVKDGRVTFQPAEGAGATLAGKPFPGGELKSDGEGEPDVISVGTLRFHLIQRGDKLGIRVKDVEAPARKAFKGIDRYPVDAKWKLEAKWEPLPTPKKLAVPTVLGTVEEMTAYGTLVFTVDGKEQRLTPVQDSPTDKLFVIFADPTNKHETYGAGRFLYADPEKGGKVTLDFNRAYNPPCAFSAFATCPLPPRENRMAVEVRAGERKYGTH